MGQGALFHVVGDERSVVFGAYTLEHYAQKVAVGLQYSLLHGIALHVLHAVDGLEHAHHRVAHLYGILLRTLQGHEVAHGDMASETNHLVAY